MCKKAQAVREDSLVSLLLHCDRNKRMQMHDDLSWPGQSPSQYKKERIHTDSPLFGNIMTKIYWSIAFKSFMASTYASMLSATCRAFDMA